MDVSSRVLNFLTFVMPATPSNVRNCMIAQGADELVFLDITASSDDRGTMVDVVARTAEQCFMPLTVGGGIRTVDDFRTMLLAGADKVSVNTAAIRTPQLISDAAQNFGSQCVVVAIDAKRDTPGRWRVYTHGGRNPTELDAVAWAREVAKRGAGEILLTSMDADGTCGGYDLELTAAVSAAVDYSGDRQRRSRRTRPPRRGPRPRSRRRRPGSQHIPFRHLQHRSGKAFPGRTGHSRYVL